MKMNIIFIIWGFFLIAVIETSFFLFWFVHHYLSSKNMTFRQFWKRTRKVLAIAKALDKGKKIGSYRFRQFMERNGEPYSIIFANVHSLCLGEFILLLACVICCIVMKNDMGSWIVLLIYAGGYGYLFILIWGRERLFSRRIDKYIVFLSELQMDFGDEMLSFQGQTASDSLINKNVGKNAEKQVRSQGRQDEQCHTGIGGNGYNSSSDHNRPDTEEKWFDKKPLWIFAGIAVIALCAGCLFYSIKQIKAVADGNADPLSIWTSDKLMYIAPVALAVAVLLYLIITRKKKDRFSFLTDWEERVHIFIFGCSDKRVLADNVMYEWHLEIKKMCSLLKIKGIVVEARTDTQNFAQVSVDKYGMSHVTFDSGWMRDMQVFYESNRWDTFFDGITFVIGHEFAHIHFKDTNRVRGISKQLLVVVVSIGCLSLVSCLISLTGRLPVGVSAQNIIILSVLGVTFLTAAFIGYPMCDTKYW